MNLFRLCCLVFVASFFVARAQEPDLQTATSSSTTVPSTEVTESAPAKPSDASEVTPSAPKIPGTLAFLEENDRTLFTPGSDPGHVGDNPSRPHRRLVQRTIMLSEPTPSYGAVLTFDDQLIPFTKEESSARDVAHALQKVGARAIFFANAPGVSAHDVSRIARQHAELAAAQKACQALLDERREPFVSEMVYLLQLTAAGTTDYTCEIYNHTAFHQDMRALKPDTVRFQLCLDGIAWVESCLDDAYQQARPGFERVRWFRFPFLHDPRQKAAKEAVIATFNELGLLSLGETQDSKDVLNLSADKAYSALQAATKNRRYNPKFGGVYSQTDQPIALFHTKTWRKVGPGILKAVRAGGIR